MQQSIDIDHKKMKTKLLTTYTNRLNLILETELSARNMTKASNSFAVSAGRLSFSRITWRTTNLENINRLTNCTSRYNSLSLEHIIREAVFRDFISQYPRRKVEEEWHTSDHYTTRYWKVIGNISTITSAPTTYTNK